jgi:hypothetical protein
VTPSKRPDRTDIAILIATAAVGFAAVVWADHELLRAERPLPAPRDLARLPSIRALTPLYRRVHHDLVWVCAAATLGSAALLARDRRTWTRRGLSRPGTAMAFIATLVGSFACVRRLHGLKYAITRTRPASDVFGDALETHVPAAILGILVVASLMGRRRADWRERLAQFAGCLWLANLGLLMADEILFG